MDNKARLTWEMGYLTVLHVRLGAKIGDRHAKDSTVGCKISVTRLGRERAASHPTKIYMRGDSFNSFNFNHLN